MSGVLVRIVLLPSGLVWRIAKRTRPRSYRMRRIIDGDLKVGLRMKAKLLGRSNPGYLLQNCVSALIRNMIWRGQGFRGHVHLRTAVIAVLPREN